MHIHVLPGELGRLILEGRRNEFATFAAFADPDARSRIPDPQALTTFGASKLKWAERDSDEHRQAFALHKRLLALRASDPVLRGGSRRQLSAEHLEDVLVVRRRSDAGARTLLMNFGERTRRLVDLLPMVPGPILLRSDLGPLEGSELPQHTAVIVGA